MNKEYMNENINDEELENVNGGFREVVKKADGYVVPAPAHTIMNNKTEVNKVKPVINGNTKATLINPVIKNYIDTNDVEKPAHREFV